MGKNQQYEVCIMTVGGNTVAALSYEKHKTDSFGVHLLAISGEAISVPAGQVVWAKSSKAKSEE